MGDIHLATGVHAVVRAASSDTTDGCLAAALTAYTLVGHKPAWLGQDAS
jgi:hypothetical protein